MLDKSVKIINNSVKKYKDYDLCGKVGRIVRTRCSTGSPCTLKSIGVKVDGILNTASQWGIFWIDPTDAILINEKENKTDMEDVKICVVKDVDGRRDFAFCFENLKDNAMVVCDYRYGNDKLSVRRVVRVLEEGEAYSEPVCEILGSVDTSARDEALRKALRRKELEERMELRASQIEQNRYYEFLAERDEEMAELYKEYINL